jgi:hypothetical protein
MCVDAPKAERHCVDMLGPEPSRRHLIVILIHRAGRSIDAEPDKTPEHNISGGHRFSV